MGRRRFPNPSQSPSFGRPRLLRIQWNSLEFNGIHWNSLEFNGIHWNSLEFIGIHWNPLVFIGIQWNSLEFIGIHWNSLEYIGIHWNPLEFIGIHWNSLEFQSSSMVFWTEPAGRRAGSQTAGNYVHIKGFTLKLLETTYISKDLGMVRSWILPRF